MMPDEENRNRITALGFRCYIMCTSWDIRLDINEIPVATSICSWSRNANRLLRILWDVPVFNDGCHKPTELKQMASNSALHSVLRKLINWFYVRVSTMRAICRRSQIKVHADERTQVHSAQSFLVVTHPSTNRARRYLTSVTESPSKHWSTPRKRELQCETNSALHSLLCAKEWSSETGSALHSLFTWKEWS